MAHPLLGEEDYYRHRAGFEAQPASPFMKSVKAPQILGEVFRA
jgi:predicted N-acetyltransferase YhbS